VNGRKRKKRIANPNRPQSSFRDAWHTLRGKAKIDPSLRLHDFRHTVATDVARAGVASAAAMALMGWKSAAMRSRYEHMQTDELRRAMNQVETTLWREAKRAEQQRPATAPNKPFLMWSSSTI
jgi:integrase